MRPELEASFSLSTTKVVTGVDIEAVSKLIERHAADLSPYELTAATLLNNLILGGGGHKEKLHECLTALFSASRSDAK